MRSTKILLTLGVGALLLGASPALAHERCGYGDHCSSSYHRPGRPTINLSWLGSAFHPYHGYSRPRPQPYWRPAPCGFEGHHGSGRRPSNSYHGYGRHPGR